MTPQNTNPAPSPETAPASKETQPAPAPQKTEPTPPAQTQPSHHTMNMKTNVMAVGGNHCHNYIAPPPRWLTFLAMFVRLVWPLAMLGCGVALFVIIGAGGWLWLVLALIIVCAVFARPPQPPAVL